MGDRYEVRLCVGSDARHAKRPGWINALAASPSGKGQLEVSDIAIGEQIYHDPICKCRHKKGLHSGYQADGRCVNRSCGCGRYEPREVPDLRLVEGGG